jgi:hypothetical protein
MAVRRAWARRGLALVSVLGVVTVLLPRAAAAAPPPLRTVVSNLPLTARTNLTQLASTHSAADAGGFRFRRPELPERGKDIGAPDPGVPAPPTPPNPALTPVTTTNPGFTGFQALDATDATFPATGEQFEGEPPDQGLCVGTGGRALETINTVLAVFDAAGHRLTAPVGLNQFFGLSPELTRTKKGATFGPFVFDPDCIFDPDTRRFFVIADQLGIVPTTGDLTETAFLNLAVSATDDPRGDWATFTLEVGRGDQFDTGCPCFDDYPHMGYDANGVYVGANRVGFETDFFNSKIHAFDKRRLADLAAGAAPGKSGARAVTITPGSAGGQPSFTLQPSTTPIGAPHAPNTEYFMSTPDFFDFSSDQVVVWALGNTASLRDATPSLTLDNTVVPTLLHVTPEKAPQRNGPHPLGESYGLPVNHIEVGTDQVYRVVFVNGLLWASIPTAVKPVKGTDSHVGILWVAVAPHLQGSKVDATNVHQGYLAIATDNLVYPAIALDHTGNGAMVLGLFGPTRFPGAGYVPWGTSGPIGAVHQSVAGAAPEDGFSCYDEAGGDTERGCRWGDYSAGQADDQGRLWMATEVIPPGPRLEFTNWGTFVGSLAP